MPWKKEKRHETKQKTRHSPETPFSTTWLSAVDELGFSAQLSPTRHRQSIHKVTKFLNSMTGAHWRGESRQVRQINSPIVLARSCRNCRSRRTVLLFINKMGGSVCVCVSVTLTTCLLLLAYAKRLRLSQMSSPPTYFYTSRFGFFLLLSLSHCTAKRPWTLL